MTSSQDWWTAVVSPIVFVIVGAVISLYATIIFERYKFFVDTVREVRSARLTLGRDFLPVYVEGIPECCRLGYEYSNFLELKQGQLEAAGQSSTAKQIERLHAFAYEATGRIVAMQNALDLVAGSPEKHAVKAKAIQNLLSAFQLRFNKVSRDEFTDFERNMRPNRGALLRPWPQPLVANEANASGVQYFVDLPSARNV
ncbi:hypothetical protein G3T36_17995 [Diaminobutyricibacter tongyongensis]|uniref:Uncharacterized protein n=1 Tax=Leifsonia tongyongensis TaxID=1268043 RepID=A0A6L9Y241_9MICO|nr:hypothetical protein [Diaminobutyricibacter tongyongensis]NEN07752.1 hypothetical protein [Diaminobutyricibacter tongyongensis]